MYPKKKPKTDEERFHEIFSKKVGTTPGAYLRRKLAAGVPEGDLRRMYDMLAVELARTAHCKAIRFDEALGQPDAKSVHTQRAANSRVPVCPKCGAQMERRTERAEILGLLELSGLPLYEECGAARMRNFKMTLSYDGSRYFGWERQPGKETIQGKLEAVLTRMCGTPVNVIGAGRTDAGVHARAMVANAYMDTDMEPESIRDYLNHYLPDDIGVAEVKEAADRFHARYRAVGKLYTYTCYVGETKPVFNRKYVTVLDGKPDVEKMRKAAEFLVGEHDFRSFCANPQMKKSTVRIVDSIEIQQKKDLLYLNFHGTGFLQNMVRILTGTLLEVGFGKRSVASVKEVLEAKDRKLAGYTAPPQGLCLMRVDY